MTDKDRGRNSDPKINTKGNIKEKKGRKRERETETER